MENTTFKHYFTSMKHLIYQTENSKTSDGPRRRTTLEYLPKNIYSKPIKINFKNTTVKIEITEEIPPIEPEKDTDYIKHVKIKSELLSKFWGRPMYLQANVLIPKDFKKESKTRYPLMVFHGHFQNQLAVSELHHQQLKKRYHLQ